MNLLDLAQNLVGGVEILLPASLELGRDATRDTLRARCAVRRDADSAGSSVRNNSNSKSGLASLGRQSCPAVLLICDRWSDSARN